jgi:hypothetical protein
MTEQEIEKTAQRIVKHERRERIYKNALLAILISAPLTIIIGGFGAIKLAEYYYTKKLNEAKRREGFTLHEQGTQNLYVFTLDKGFVKRVGTQQEIDKLFDLATKPMQNIQHYIHDAEYENLRQQAVIGEKVLGQVSNATMVTLGAGLVLSLIEVPIIKFGLFPVFRRRGEKSVNTITKGKTPAEVAALFSRVDQLHR